MYVFSKFKFYSLPFCIVCGTSGRPLHKIKAKFGLPVKNLIVDGLTVDILVVHGLLVDNLLLFGKAGGL